MTPLHQMSREELLLHFGKASYFLLSTISSYVALFHAMNKSSKGRWMIQAYGILNLILAGTLCWFSQQVSEWRVFRRRHGWIVKTAVGIFMLGFSTFAGVMRAETNTESGAEVQLLIVGTMFLHVQLVGPSTDFGLVNFGLRIPILTSYLVYGVKKWPLYVVVLSMICCTIFQEFCAGRREEKVRRDNAQINEDEKAELKRRNVSLENENVKLNASLDESQRETLLMRMREEKLKKEKGEAVKTSDQLLRFINRR